MIYTFDPAKVSVIFNAKIMSGFQDGNFVTVERSEQAYNLKIGIAGEGARVKSNNRSGKITIVLMQTSPSNDDLSALTAADELSNTGMGPFILKDSSGRTVCSAQNAWVMKYPQVEMAREETGRTWVLETEDLQMFVAGN